MTPGCPTSLRAQNAHEVYGSRAPRRQRCSDRIACGSVLNPRANIRRSYRRRHTIEDDIVLRSQNPVAVVVSQGYRTQRKVRTENRSFNDGSVVTGECPIRASSIGRTGIGCCVVDLRYGGKPKANKLTKTIMALRIFDAKSGFTKISFHICERLVWF